MGYERFEIGVTRDGNFGEEGGLNRWSARRAVEVFQLFSHEAEIDVAVNHSQQMISRDLLFQTKIIK